DLWLKPRAGSEGVLLKGLAKSLIDKGSVKQEKIPAELVSSLSQYKTVEVSRTTGIDEESLELAAEIYGLSPGNHLMNLRVKRERCKGNAHYPSDIGRLVPVAHSLRSARRTYKNDCAR
ncbi:unnamed protein product, partial [marine sediment metagenome]